MDGTRRLIDNRYAIDTTGLGPVLHHFFVRRIWRGKPKQNYEGLGLPRPKLVPEFRPMSVHEHSNTPEKPDPIFGDYHAYNS